VHFQNLWIGFTRTLSRSEYAMRKAGTPCPVMQLHDATLNAVGRNFYLPGMLLTVAGYCTIIFVATINSLLQHLAEDHMREKD
jgi:hypothetical protein